MIETVVQLDPDRPNGARRAVHHFFSDWPWLARAVRHTFWPEERPITMEGHARASRRPWV